MKKLIKYCKRLDRKAQREMLDHLSVLLFPICLRYAKNKEDAKDLLQESLILIFNNMHQSSSDEPKIFKAWCKKIAINNALGKFRKKMIDCTTLEGQKVVKFTPPNIEGQLNVEDILRLLKKLPKNQKTVFNLSVIDGFSHKEIAQLLAIKESSSRTFLLRARQTLQGLLMKEDTFNLHQKINI